MAYRLISLEVMFTLPVRNWIINWLSAVDEFFCCCDNNFCPINNVDLLLKMFLAQ